MHPQSPYRRAGMTLVELLVVVAIIGLLAVTVLPNLANSAEGRRSRETARAVTAFIAQSQSAALGRPALTGFGLVKLSATAEAPSIDLVPARVPDAYRGDTQNAKVTGSLQVNQRIMRLTFNEPFSSGVSCTTGDLIRFGGGGPWYLMLADASGTACTLRSGSNTSVDSLAGQTEFNTAWPDTASPQPFEILRQPQRSGVARSLGEGRCIDMYWSSVGQAGVTHLGGSALATSGTVFVLFDAAGGVRQVAAGGSRFAPDGPILLLAGRVDRAGQQPVASLNPSDDSLGANWQYADSIWIAIDPMSGICRTSPCAVGASNTSNDLVGSQSYVRSELNTGMR